MLALEGLDGEQSLCSVNLSEHVCCKDWGEQWTGGNSNVWQWDKQEIVGNGNWI